jgi:intracellular multiplication protein IcmG
MNKTNQFQDEYQFPQGEFMDPILDDEPSITPEIEQAPVVEERKPSALAGIWEQHKRMIIIVGAVVLIAVVFAILRVVHKPVDVPVKAPEQAAPTLSVQAPQAVIDPQVVDQLTALKQDSINTSSAVQQLQGQVAQLNDSLSQSRTAQQQLAQSLMVLASQMQQLTAEVKVLAQPKEVKAPKPVVKEDPAPVITFQLRAVVPGRAWIVGSDGRSLSVAIGDQVPQYGNVQSIDADSGVVITSSGKTIKF